MKRFKRALLLLLPLLIAIGVSGLLYLGTRAVDEPRHAAVLRAMERERRLHALLKREVLAARFGLLGQYDPLESALADAEATRLLLVEQMKHGEGRQKDVADALAALQAESVVRRDQVQRFKTENSVLKNSLHYLPVAADLLNERLASSGAPSERVSAWRRDVNALVQATLVYNLIGGSDRKQAQAAHLASLERELPSVPDDARSDFELFLAHARTVVKQGELVDPLIQEIEDDKVEDAIGSLDRAYQDAHGVALQRAARYRLALYVWSILLLVGIVAAVAKLVGLYGNLEKLVQERTRELKRAVDALWGEMHLAKKIQTALVPTHTELHGCEIAAAMRPAEEVGGDYYDVIRVGGVEWVLIGDVSGHGVPAGLVMMMCQTAVRALLIKQPDIMPGELLTLVNSTLTANIRRLGETKYMTLQALRRDVGGGFTHAGLHQDLFIYRAAQRRVEEVKSRGMWLGIVDDVAGMIETDRVALDKGDVLLLFTDGITEAKRDGRMLDNDGLARLLEVNGEASPAEIVERILAELRDYQVDDDVSLVVIKEGLSAKDDSTSTEGHAGTPHGEARGRALAASVFH